LVFLHGPPGSGKLTVARELESLTGFRLFHNHLAVDLLEPIFEFGSPPFVDLREQLWLSVFRQAARSDVSLLFTFAPERTVRPEFPAVAESTVCSEGGRVLFVALRCAESDLERRLSDPSRAAYGKLRSPERYRELRDAGAFEFPPLRADIQLDIGALSPAEAAELVSARSAGARLRPDSTSVPLAISRLHDLPADLDQLVQASLAEGYGHLERLREVWTSGADRFALPGEALFEARQEGRLVGICGLNRDPYAGRAEVGRVRRLYVVPDARRLGIARRLVTEVLREARGRFAALRLRTTTREGMLFYQALGFHPTTSTPTATHELPLPHDERL
jgi:GNAT superfamily N-acetyltransferase